MWDVVLDTLIDAAKTLPFLLGAYWLIEYIEHRSKDPSAGLAKYGVPAGALLGCLPQCGFSVAAANLYSRRLISIGTLMAVFLATSDEALPIMLAHTDRLGQLLLLIAIKIAVALAAGYAIDLFAKKHRRPDDDEMYDIHRDCKKKPSGMEIFLAALRHTAFIFVFILAVMLALNLAVYFIGEDAIARFLMTNSPFQSALTALFGLIPNCAPSVIMTELFIAGNLSFGSLVGGLLTGAGMGLVMLFRANRNVRQNFLIAGMLYAIGAVMGFIINLF